MVCDACVLYPQPLRDLLIRLARAGLFHMRWTDRIGDEWRRALRKRHAELSEAEFATLAALNDDGMPGCVVTGYEDLEPDLKLPDPDDRHVLAAAIRAGAQVIVTFNLDDFPCGRLGKFGIEAQHPDVFIVGLFDRAPEVVADAVTAVRLSAVPPRSLDSLLQEFELLRLHGTVSRLRGMAGRELPG